MNARIHCVQTGFNVLEREGGASDFRVVPAGSPRTHGDRAAGFRRVAREKRYRTVSQLGKPAIRLALRMV